MLLILAYTLLLTNIVSSKNGEICLPIGHVANEPQPEVIQGPRGKAGLRGMKGDSGQKGDRGISGRPGICSCDFREVSDLRAKLRTVNGEL